jgi:tetratricopeptide (TPR) repeat protein
MAVKAATTSIKEIIDKAKNAESDDDIEQAATLYEQARKADPANEYTYDRLMVIYRKLKKHKEELRVINEGIKFFEDFYKNKSQQLVGKDKKIMELSNALMKRVGLQDKKGKNLYSPEPIAKWRKRKEMVEKKLGK